ncbi:hypothetical protein Tco_1499550 [Tanacetum coccineum]
MGSITSLKCVLTQEHLDAICAKYFVPEEVHPQLPSSDATMHERPAGKVGMYTRFFDYANYRIPFSTFFVSVLTHFRIPFSQLSVFGCVAKVSHFEILCRVCNINPSVGLFRYFYTHNYKNGWFGFTKRPNVRACYSKNLDSVKNWNDHFFWVDEFVVPANARFEMDLNAFIRTADPRKVRIVERARAENERPIVMVAKHRTVTLLPTSVIRGLLPLVGWDNAANNVPITDNVETETPGPKRTKKKRVTHGSERTPAASHPPKRLRADYGTTGGSATGALPTLPFITSSVTASPLEEGGDHTDSVTGPSLRTVGPSARFVVLSNSSHHSGAKSADPEVDSLVMFVAPVMTTATTVTDFVSSVAVTAPTTIDAGKNKDVPALSVFAGSNSSDRTGRTLSLFTGRSGSEFAAGSIRAEENANVNLQEVYVPEWSVTKGFELNDGRSLSSEVRMRAEYNSLEKRRWKSLAEEKDNLLQVKDKEIEELRSQLLQAKDESIEEHNGLLEQECGSLKLKVTSLKSIIAEKDRELSDLGASSSSLRSQNQSLVNKLETSSTDLLGKLEMYKGSMKQLEEFQDNLMKPLEAILAEIGADFTRCCMHFQENFHPHLLNAIAGRRWLLTHGMKLLMAKCLNSTEYMEALGNAFGRAIEKGMQEGLAAGIEHGQAGRCLSDLEAYNPSAEADFNSAVRDLRGLDFPLLRELFAKKDASTWDVMDLLRLDDAVAEVLGMTDLQPDVGQLMVPVHHKQDKVVIGSQALSVALETCHRRVRKMERNLAERLPLLRDVFVSIDHPVSTEALAILPETSTEPLVTTLVTTALSTMVIRPNPDPFLLVEDYENLDLTGMVPADVIPGSKGEGNVEGSPTGDAGDVFSHLENEARDAVL